MSPRRVHRLFAAALTTSVIMHAVLLTFVSRAISESQRRAEIARVREYSKVVPVDLSLGIDAPTPPSETWIGYKEEVPQRAEPAEVEQAAFTDQPVAASTAPPIEQPAPQQPEMMPSEPTPPAAHENAPQTEAPQVEPLLPQNQPAEQPPPLDQTQPPQPQPQHDTHTDERPTGDLPLPDQQADDRDYSPKAADLTKWIEEISAMIEQATRSSVSESTTPPATQPSPQEVAAAQPEQPIARRPDQSSPSTGAQSDKESDPSSIIEVPREQWELGKPLAAQGLELKPRRPHFTVLTLLTSAPCNPSCEITFGKDGVATRARLITGSCDSRVDEAILNSLYGWRASGERLTQLAEGKTINVNIKLILTRRK